MLIIVMLPRLNFGEMIDIMPAAYSDISSFTVVPDNACYGNQSGVVLVYQEASVLWSVYIGAQYIAIDRLCNNRNTG